MSWFRKFRRPNREQRLIAEAKANQDRWRIERLGQYNAERSRGIVHDDEWRDYMRAEQEWFNDHAWDPRVTSI